MKFLINIIVIFFALTFSTQAQMFVGMQQPGPSLLLFYTPSCNQCKEILQNAIPYSKNEVGKKFPLLVVNMMQPLPQWLKIAFDEGRIKKKHRFPILIKWDGEKEIGRVSVPFLPLK